MDARAAAALALLCALALAGGAEGRATLDVAVAHPQAEGLAHVRAWLLQELAPALARPVRLVAQEARLGRLEGVLPRGGLLVTVAPPTRALAARPAHAPPLAVLLVGDAACRAAHAWQGAAFVLRTHWCAGMQGPAAWLPPPWRTPPAVRSFARHRHRHMPHALRALDYSLVGRVGAEARQMERAAAGAAAEGDVRLHVAVADPERARQLQQPAAAYCRLLDEARAALVPAGPRVPVQEPARMYEALQHGAVPLALHSNSTVGVRLQAMGLSMRNVRRDLAPLLERMAGPEGPALGQEVGRMWEEVREEALARARALVDEMLGD